MDQGYRGRSGSESGSIRSGSGSESSGRQRGSGSGSDRHRPASRGGGRANSSRNSPPKKDTPPRNNGPCIQYCANTFGFIFRSVSPDGKLRFSEGTIIPITKGKFAMLSRWKSIKGWHKTGEYEHIPEHCACETSDEFKQLLTDNQLGPQLFENLKKTNFDEASQFAYDSIKSLNDIHGKGTYTYVDHRGLMALLLAEIQKKNLDPTKSMSADKHPITVS